ncbi:unnamed protein product [Rhizophagus irregularis]|nr:unnamed protein product [Rhizophagus irregularis]CAB4407200.1 unnamed protein product [Rhizophagus irregularis]
MKELKKNKQWEIIFQNAIIGALKKVIRDSHTSTIASIKNRLFEVFSPNIQKLNATLDSKVIYDWKCSKSTCKCLKKLSKTYQDTNHTYQDEIIMCV